MKRSIQIRDINRITLRNPTIDKYMIDVNKHPLLTPDEEYKLAVDSSNGNMKAREKLILSNLRFAISVAKIYSGNNVSKFQDLINEGNLGLVEAAENFDPTMGFKFISHAVWYVRKNILNVCVADIFPLLEATVRAAPTLFISFNSGNRRANVRSINVLPIPGME